MYRVRYVVVCASVDDECIAVDVEGCLTNASL